jgi:hypothetical protein
MRADAMRGILEIIQVHRLRHLSFPNHRHRYTMNPLIFFSRHIPQFFNLTDVKFPMRFARVWLIFLKKYDCGRGSGCGGVAAAAAAAAAAAVVSNLLRMFDVLHCCRFSSSFAPPTLRLV